MYISRALVAKKATGNYIIHLVAGNITKATAYKCTHYTYVIL